MGLEFSNHGAGAGAVSVAVAVAAPLGSNEPCGLTIKRSDPSVTDQRVF